MDNDLACHRWSVDVFQFGLTQCLFPADYESLMLAVTYSYRVYMESMYPMLSGGLSSCSASTTATNSGSPEKQAIF